MTEEDIKKLLPEDEELVNFLDKFFPLVFFVSKKKEGKYPFLLRGYCGKRQEIYEKFLAADTLEGAVYLLQTTISKIRLR